MEHSLFQSINGSSCSDFPSTPNWQASTNQKIERPDQMNSVGIYKRLQQRSRYDAASERGVIVSAAVAAAGEPARELFRVSRGVVISRCRGR